MHRGNGKPRVHARDHEHGGADPTLIVYEDVGDEGGGSSSSSSSSFAITGGPFTLTDAETILDTPDSPRTMHFSSLDPATFDSATGRARIQRPGFYLVGFWADCEIDGVPVSDEQFTLILEYGSGAGTGSSIEASDIPTPNTILPFPAGTSDSYEATGQRIHPLSLTTATSFPLVVRPTIYATNADGSMSVAGMSVWGVRLSDPLDSYHSD